MHIHTPLPLLSSLLLLLFHAAATTAAAVHQPPQQPHQEKRQQLTIYTPPASAGYTYHGCYNETTDLPNTTGARALAGGTDEVLPGNMTVQTCLDFCRTGAGDASGGTSGRFAFAGLEYSRECWCAQSLSSLSAKLSDSDCNLPCEGNTTEACGGSLKLTVYMASTASAARGAWAAALVAVGAMSLTMVL